MWVAFVLLLVFFWCPKVLNFKILQSISISFVVLYFKMFGYPKCIKTNLFSFINIFFWRFYYFNLYIYIFSRSEIMFVSCEIKIRIHLSPHTYLIAPIYLLKQLFFFSTALQCHHCHIWQIKRSYNWVHFFFLPQYNTVLITRNYTLKSYNFYLKRLGYWPFAF